MRAEPEYTLEERDLLTDLLVQAIRDTEPFKRIMAKLRARNDAFPIALLAGEDAANFWHRGVSGAVDYGMEVELVEYLEKEVAGRVDVPDLQRLLTRLRRPLLSDKLRVRVEDLWNRVNQLTEDVDPQAAVDDIEIIRDQVLRIQRLFDEPDWAGLLPGQTRTAARRVRDQLINCCLDALSACDLVSSVPGDNLVRPPDDERDRLRYLVARNAAYSEAKGRAIRSIRNLCEALASRIPGSYSLIVERPT